MKTGLVVALGVAVLLSGCAVEQYHPLVDSGISRGSYEADLADCQQLAAQRPAAAQAAGGATVGAVLGAAPSRA